MLKQYIIENGGSTLLSDVMKKNRELPDAVKCRCVNFVADFGVSIFGLSPETHQYKNLALAAVDLMPMLESTSGSSIVCSIQLNIFFFNFRLHIVIYVVL